ncbi:CPBP family intramembrane glutamic endopeptidase [Paenibacillus sp. MMS20-IR301]|uniref:CPBP family intramembrane glutamic endopeptidase n=1 Tax=Paenibacillus sp. MMS20-IR301 TaxID=2895946 RepID=UPI0028E534F7|nr:CPBP family intramembrane glutamic endopeptidase [Paenibacillus sp. MMS20-IR301]WNS44729.1 CPBP family intramembrane glutamic endopeptidase [Paenibacillus sp. MMS20-IR301]
MKSGMQLRNRVQISIQMLILFLIGYTISHFLMEGIAAVFYYEGMPDEVRIIVSRFSVLGYILPFLFLAPRSVFNSEFFRIGDFQSSIFFPFIWRGKEDPVWRFLIIFVFVAPAGSSFFIYFFISHLDGSSLRLLLYYGLLFSLVNSILEELVWRGIILNQFVKWSGNVYGLIVTSLFFGMAHYDLGFSLGMCIAFSVGGFFMGGTAIRSKGLVASILMHIYMNLVFVLTGLIFS